MREDNSKDLDLGETIILKWILLKYNGMVLIGFIWLRIWTNGMQL
jgi:hypothetical protein